MSKCRGRRRLVPMHHQRVLDVQSSSSTADRQNTAGSAHCRKHIIEETGCPPLDSGQADFRMKPW
eukprot:scaffold59197_cov28-Phaeocystis_antarctica.AAC.1